MHFVFHALAINVEEEPFSADAFLITEKYLGTDLGPARTPLGNLQLSRVNINLN